MNFVVAASFFICIFVQAHRKYTWWYTWAKAIFIHLQLEGYFFLASPVSNDIPLKGQKRRSNSILLLRWVCLSRFAWINIPLKLCGRWREKKKGVWRKIHHSYRDNTKRYIHSISGYIYLYRIFLLRSPKKHIHKKGFERRRSPATFILSSLRRKWYKFHAEDRMKFICFFKSRKAPIQHWITAKCSTKQSNNSMEFSLLGIKNLLLGSARNRFIPVTPPSECNETGTD